MAGLILTYAAVCALLIIIANLSADGEKHRIVRIIERRIVESNNTEHQRALIGLLKEIKEDWTVDD